MGEIKYWDGSSWVTVTPSVYDGSAWSDVPVKYWDGSSWVLFGSSSTSPVLVDDFEDGDLSQYASIAEASVQTGTVNSGTYALQFDTPDGTSYTFSSTSGLNAYPSAGDTFEFYVYMTDASDYWKFSFGSQSETALSSGTTIVEGYHAHFKNDSFEINVRSGGSTTVFAGPTSVNPPENEWLRGEVSWGSNGSMTATLYDASGSEIASVSGSDSTYSTGGIGYYCNNSAGNASTQYWDDINII